MYTTKINILLWRYYVSQIVYYAGEKNFIFIANTFDKIIRNNFPFTDVHGTLYTHIEPYKYFVSTKISISWN